MLDELITTEDVERKQLFRCRNGQAVTLIEQFDVCPDKWIYISGDNKHRVVTSDGKHYYEEADRDLISRIKEPEMESQVVVEDRREHTDAERPWMGIDELTSKTIFEVHGDNRKDVYMTVYGHHVICLTNKASYHDATSWCVRPLPHLRLRLVLEERA